MSTQPSSDFLDTFEIYDRDKQHRPEDLFNYSKSKSIPIAAAIITSPNYMAAILNERDGEVAELVANEALKITAAIWDGIMDIRKNRGDI